ncbi:aspartyl-phosphate phosphatase Spo0E family protein [Sediminibacillus albus]|nr:aspartyl-phosphate phosphatase Spo0E family protein [Sediminibacillus albus]
MNNQAEIGLLTERISNKRKELYLLADAKGLASREVLQCSKELDKLIFLLQRIKYQLKEKQE